MLTQVLGRFSNAGKLRQLAAWRSSGPDLEPFGRAMQGGNSTGSCMGTHPGNPDLGFHGLPQALGRRDVGTIRFHALQPRLLLKGGVV